MHSSQANFPNNGNGENLATTNSPNRNFYPEFVSERWFEEKDLAYGGKGYQPGTISSNPIYGNPGGPDQVGHYTAMIWNSTQHLGCASCDGDNNNGFYVDVCQYSDLTPNVVLNGGPALYIQNVPQNNSFVKSEEDCCNMIYMSGLNFTMPVAYEPRRRTYYLRGATERFQPTFSVLGMNAFFLMSIIL